MDVRHEQDAAPRLIQPGAHRLLVAVEERRFLNLNEAG
jgi:hypothetical protein